MPRRRKVPKQFYGGPDRSLLHAFKAAAQVSNLLCGRHDRGLLYAAEAVPRAQNQPHGVLDASLL